MPSVAELAPHTNFQENVGDYGVCRSLIPILLSKLTAESRFLTGSVMGTMVLRWTIILLNYSFPDKNEPRGMRGISTSRPVEGSSNNFRAVGYGSHSRRPMISLSILAIHMISWGEYSCPGSSKEPAPFAFCRLVRARGLCHSQSGECTVQKILWISRSILLPTSLRQ
jgi:hypothetical protein